MGLLYDEIFFSNKKKWTIKFKKRPLMTLKCIFLSERSQSLKTTYCMISIIRRSGKKKKAKLWRQEKDQKLPGEGVGGDQSGEHREF